MLKHKYRSLVTRLKSDIRAIHERIEYGTTLSRQRLEKKLNETAAELDQNEAHTILNFLELKQHLINANLSKILQSSSHIFHGDDERYRLIDLKRIKCVK